MKNSRFSDSQIIGMLKEAEGTPRLNCAKGTASALPRSMNGEPSGGIDASLMSETKGRTVI